MRTRTSIPWQILLTGLIGCGLGLGYAWFIAPVEYINADPAMLRTDFKDHFREVIAAAYASNADLERARARLAVLGDADVIQALSAQAQQMLAAGEPFERVSQVAQLASDIQSGQPNVQIIQITDTSQAEPATAQSTFVLTDNQAGEPGTGTPVVETPSLIVTITPRPTRTPTFTPGPAFALVGQEPQCDPDTGHGLLQVMLMDARRRQIPGIEITVTWGGGEDRFYTGLKPELGNGYADFQMDSSKTYSVKIAEGGTQVSSVIPPPCSLPNGEIYSGNLLLTFQQP